eukprot:TRINITY_DN87144_c0_g1_i1.p1 TRINITY_DN87144_c0_g1~~TRINITY_DN87144_c0_g1_i1.p1  ORF type:complete len:449 (+),score=63.98 TRINITY_DN87144_c0_g1_i1:114-1460(+)
MPPKAKTAAAKGPPPPKAKAKSATQSCAERPKAAKIRRASSGEIVQEWREQALPGSVEKLDWSSLESFVYISGGSGGVILVRFAGGESSQLCCVKPQRTDAAAELFASFLAEALGVPTARLRVLPKTEEICRALKKAVPAIEEHANQLEIKILAGTHFFGILEFVNGPIMEGIDFVETLQRQSHDAVEQFWQALGKLIAFDCIINNYDRLPLIWDNEGNLKNVMIDGCSVSRELRVVGIDQAVRAITRKDGLDAYCARLRQLTRSVFSREGSQGLLEGPFKRINDAIHTSFMGRLSLDSVQVRIGICNAFQDFSRRLQSGELGSILTSCQSWVAETFHERPEGVGASQIELHNFKFLVESAVAAISEEIGRLAVPAGVLGAFSAAFPAGHLQRDELVLFLQLLEPTISEDMIGRIFTVLSDQVKAVPPHLPKDGESIDCEVLLQWMFS